MKQFTLTRSKISIQTSHEIGHGGEGVVFSIKDQSDRVAKIYSTPPDQRKIQKLTAMAALASPDLLKIAAWPIDLLADSNGRVQGFVMPRVIARRGIHELYSPKGRSEAFPEADFQFLVHVGANIARAFAVVHEHGHVLGDINHGNLLAGSDGTVMLIDCDSFQIKMGADVFTCDVGVPLFTAPELHGQQFRNLLRTNDHDLFGLAVLLFHLLYMGRHPFAGRYSGVGDMPIEKAIAEHRFAYGPDRADYGMERPPGTISLETMGVGIAQHFVQAFTRPGSNGGRPDANAWLKALETLKTSLRECSTASWHHYPGELGACPWCALETQTAVRLFGQPILGWFRETVDISALWQAIQAIRGPGDDPVLPSQLAQKMPADVGLHKRALRNIRQVLSIGLICSGIVACSALEKNRGMWALASYVLALVIWPWVSAERRSAAERAYAVANTEWQAILERWRHEASQNAFTIKMKDLEKAHIELTDLPNERRRRLSKLEANREDIQRRRYLDRFRIDRGNIPQIGSSRTSMLASYGIETANDIYANKIKQIPGFGDVYTSKLVAWRKGHEQNFRFNPQEPVDRRDIEAMDRELEARRQILLTVLRQGPDTLRRLSQEITAARPRLMPLLENAWTSLKIAEAQRDIL